MLFELVATLGKPEHHVDLPNQSEKQRTHSRIKQSNQTTNQNKQNKYLHEEAGDTGALFCLDSEFACMQLMLCCAGVNQCFVNAP